MHFAGKRRATAGRRHATATGSNERSGGGRKGGCTAEDQRSDALCGVGLQRCSNAGVDVGGDSLAGVVEPVLDHLHRDAGFERQGCPAVSQGVQTDDWYRLVYVSAVVAMLGPCELAAEPFGVVVVAVALSEDEVAQVV